MKTAALLLALSCCAHAQTAIPSSLPHITVDASLSGAVVSEAAGKAFLHRLAKERAECDGEKATLTSTNHALTMQRDGAVRYANRNAFWGMWGPTIAVSSGVGGALVAAAVFLAVFFGGFANGK